MLPVRSAAALVLVVVSSGLVARLLTFTGGFSFRLFLVVRELVLFFCLSLVAFCKGLLRDLVPVFLPSFACREAYRQSPAKKAKWDTPLSQKKDQACLTIGSCGVRPDAESDPFVVSMTGSFLSFADLCIDL